MKLYTGNETTEETIRMFAAADGVIGFHGAALANSVFARGQPCIIEISIEGWRSNIALLGATSDFFDQLAVQLPTFDEPGSRFAALMFAEHFLILLKLFIDFVVPDVPDNLIAKLERDRPSF